MPNHLHVKSNLMQEHLRCKKAVPSKLESYLEVNALTDWHNKI